MSSKSKVLLTGITSFSGCQIASGLIESEHRVIAPLLSPKAAYTGLKQTRLQFAKGAELIENCDIQSADFLKIIENYQPEVFINHAAYIENYRSLDFDFLKHLEVNLKNIKQLIQQLKGNGCKLLIHSGSAFEPGEEYSKYGVSPYGVAKKMVWDMLCFWCTHYKLPVVKIVIPNPYGYLENDDRLLPVFARLIGEGQRLNLSEPHTIRNNIRGEELAKYYLQAVELSETKLPEDFVFIIKPIGHIETQQQFVLRALQEKPYNIELEKIFSLLAKGEE